MSYKCGPFCVFPKACLVIMLMPLFKIQYFMYFCIRKYIGTQGEICRQLKIFLTPPPHTHTPPADRSKVVVSVLFLFSVVVFYCFEVFPCSFPRVSSFLLALWSPRLGKRELVCVLLVHLFVCFVHVSFCRFPLSLGVGVGCGFWLWHSLDFLWTFLF